MRLAPLLALLAVPPLTAQEWVEIGAPSPLVPSGQECDVRSVTPTPAGLVVTTPCGPYRLDGDRWERLGEAAPSEIEVTPDGTLYGLIPDEEVLRYEEETGTWSALPEGLPDPGDGESFSLFGPTADADGSLWVTSLVMSPVLSPVGGLFYLPAGGDSWTAPDRDGMPNQLLALLPDDELAGIYLSCDLDPPCSLGTHIGRPGAWTVGGPADDLESAWGFGFIEALALAPSAGSAAYVGIHSDGVIRSPDGAVWERADFPGQGALDLLTLDRSVLAASYEGLFQSDDGGVTWSPFPAPFYDAGGVAIDLALGPDGIAYAAASAILDGSFAAYRTAEPLATAEALPRATLRLVTSPNPTLGAATVSYDLPRPGYVRLDVFDVLGRRVATLEDGARAAGPHAAHLSGLAAGVFVLRLTSEAGQATAQVTVLDGR